MRHSLLQLACAAAIGALALSAQAQYSAPTPAATQPASPSAAPSTSSKMNPDAAKQADADFQAAQAKCNALTGDAKTTCLNDAKAAYDRALGQTTTDAQAASPGAAPGGGGSAGAQGNMSKQRQ